MKNKTQLQIGAFNASIDLSDLNGVKERMIRRVGEPFLNSINI
jgi:hypothetical protein